MFSINISMVTNIYSGTASGQALFNDESCVSQIRLGTVVQELISTAEQWLFQWSLALGCAARKGFLKMLIHRWYRMLQPSAWLSWDTKLAHVSQQGLVFLKSTSAWDKEDFFIFMCVILKSATLRQSEKFIEQHRLTRCDAFGKQGFVDAESLWWEQRDSGKHSKTPGWWLVVIWIYGMMSQLFQPSSVDLLCPDFGVQTFLLYFNAFFSEQHCIVAAVKLDCCSLRQFTL